MTLIGTRIRLMVMNTKWSNAEVERNENDVFLDKVIWRELVKLG